jgi:predicted dehydrogenase
MLAAARRRTDLRIQIGTQRRSRPHYAEVKALIDDGRIGRVHFIRTFDCRNYLTQRDPFTPDSVGQGQVDWKTAKIDWDRFQAGCDHKTPFDPLRYTAWRWYWDYAGGLLTDVGVHVIDCVHGLLGEPTPKSAVCHGGVYGLDYWQTPDVVNAVWDYGDYSIAFTGNFTSGAEGDGFLIYGSEATIEVRGNDVKVWEGPVVSGGDRTKPIREISGERVTHVNAWIRAIRGEGQITAPVELGISSMLPAHLANLAYRRGTRVTWDAEARKVV